jgi:hypothetical protein
MKTFLTTFFDNFKAFDRSHDGSISFFFRHWGKSKFMVSMSKKVQYLGVERLWEMSASAFWYFVLFYLIRDVVIYIIVPIFVSKLTTH